MRKARRQAADRIAAKLFSAEVALSKALIELAGLVDTMETERASANLSLVVGAEPASHTIQCLMALGTAREALVKAHEGFAATHQSIGLGAVAIGVGGGEKPQSMLQPVSKLSVAA